MTAPQHEPPPPTPAAIRKVMIAGAIGTSVEWFDYFVYGTAAALVLNHLFFPDASPAIGTLAAFATFAVGFLARPLGAIVFGHFGDRHGRKRMLVVSLGTMGLATFCIGLLPTYGTVGAAAPVLLVALRLLQGFAVGGEWGGAVVLATEYARPSRRGLVGSIVQIGSPAGLLISTGSFALVSLLPKSEQYAWGWRVPFLASVLLVCIGLYIRLSIVESPEFRRAEQSGETVRMPLVEVFRTSWRSVLVAVGARFAPDIGFYVCGTFLVSYGSDQLGLDSETILLAVTAAAFVEMFSVPFFGWLSDRIGRRLVYLAGSLFWVVFAFPIFWLVDSRAVPLAWVAILLALVIGHGAMWSVGAALYAELFPTRIRLTGASIGYQCSIVVGGGPAPFIATALVAWTAGASWPVATYLVLAGVISFVSLLLSRETAQRDLSVDERLVGVENVTSTGPTTAATTLRAGS